jgi:predicted kinase
LSLCLDTQVRLNFKEGHFRWPARQKQLQGFIMEAVILIGIQAVGKSTFYLQRFAETHIRLNLDMLKTRNRERILLEACIAARQPFVVDNTNVTAQERSRYIGLARAAKFRVLGYYFQSTLTDAIRRNRRRTAPRLIPEKGIAATYNRLQTPSLDEGFDKLYYVTIGDPDEFVVRERPDGL